MGKIGAVLLVLVVVFIIGELWFHLVDGIVEAVKGVFRKKQPWHPLPEEEKEKKE